MNFQGTKGIGITNKLGFFHSTVAKKYLHVNITAPPPPHCLTFFFFSTQPPLLKTSFACFSNLRHNSPGEIEARRQGTNQHRMLGKLNFPWICDWLRRMFPFPLSSLALTPCQVSLPWLWMSQGWQVATAVPASLACTLRRPRAHRKRKEHTYAVTRLRDRKPQRVTTARSRRPACSCLLVRDSVTLCERAAAIRTCSVRACVFISAQVLLISRDWTSAIDRLWNRAKTQL